MEEFTYRCNECGKETNVSYNIEDECETVCEDCYGYWIVNLHNNKEKSYNTNEQAER